MTARGRSFTHAETGTSEARWRERREWGQVIPLPALATTGASRVVVVAAHPDDETLAAGGLMALAAQTGLEVVVVLLTDGERSHPDSSTMSEQELARHRVEESRQALRLLAPGGRLERLGLPDGSVADHADAVVTALVDVIGEDGDRTVLAAPWRDDGHADHDTAGLAASVAARRTDATLWEYPVWLWHWCDPEHAPWAAFRALPLPDDIRRAKGSAIVLHRTQVAPLTDATGDEVVLHDGMLEHFRRPFEVFLQLDPAADDSLERLHDTSADPWRVRTSWYEQRKRLVTLAALPHQRYDRALEVGGSVGALAAELCQALRRAGRRRRERRRDLGGPRVARHRHERRGCGGRRLRAAGQRPRGLARRAFRPGRRVRGRLLPEPGSIATTGRPRRGFPFGRRRGRALPLATSRARVAP